MRAKEWYVDKEFAEELEEDYWGLTDNQWVLNIMGYKDDKRSLLSIPLQLDGKTWRQHCYDIYTKIKGKSCSGLVHLVGRKKNGEPKRGKVVCARYVKSRRRIVVEKHKPGECPYTSYTTRKEYHDG